MSAELWRGPKKNLHLPSSCVQYIVEVYVDRENLVEHVPVSVFKYQH